MKLLVSVAQEAFRAKLRGYPQRLVSAVLRVTQRFAITIQRAVKEDKLTGQVLHNRTGTLRRSINQEMVIGAGKITAIVGTNVVYAGIHEYGGTIRPHLVEAKNAKFLRFMGRDGKWTFRKAVMIPEVHMPERSFLRSTLQEYADPYREAVLDAAVEAIA